MEESGESPLEDRGKRVASETRTPHPAVAQWGRQKAEAKDNAEAQRARRFRRGTPYPPAFCKKSPQAVENKGSGHEKESKEKRRGGKLMKRRGLPRRHREHRAEMFWEQASGARGDTWGCGRRRDETGTRSAEPWTDITASVTLCQVRNKDCGLNGLQGCNEESG
jgi:hypothetical protein